MKKGNCRVTAFLLFPFFSIVLGTCGLEDYPVIYPIPQSNVSQEMNDRATIRIPNNNTNPPFSHFAIFYRIYVSDTLEVSTTARTTYSGINSALASDYNAILPYIDSETLVNSNMDSIIRVNRKYKYLSLQNADINVVLGTASLNSTLVFDFSTGKYPSMTVNGTSTYVLMRSADISDLPSPRPDRNFVNSDDLWNSDYINETTNADVQDKSGISGNHYTYTALFIAAVGLNETTWSYIYSTPSLIHVFLLPEKWY